MDFILFQWINGFAGTSFALDVVAVFLASYFQYLLVGSIFLLFWRKRNDLFNRFTMFQTVAAVIFSRFLITPFIRFFYERPRPFVALASAVQLVDVRLEEYFNSFPSGHATFFFALAGAVYSCDKKLGWWFFTGATLMGIARVFAGVHWPSDILGGAVIGIVSAWAVTKAWRQTSSSGPSQ